MDEFQSGFTVGNFQLGEVLDRGETTSRFRALDVRTGAQVALKMVDVRDEEEADRLIREAQLYGAIDHPSVLSIYDAGEFEGQVFIAIEFAPGASLAELVERDGPL